jgi:transaldolase
MSGFDQFKSMSVLLNRYQYPAKIIAASLKNAEQVRECAEIGTHAVTMNKDVFLSFIENHPETVKRIDRFSKDWQTAQARKILHL